MQKKFFDSLAFELGFDPIRDHKRWEEVTRSEVAARKVNKHLLRNFFN